MNTSTSHEIVPVSEASSSGLRFGAVLGVLVVNLVILGYAISRALPGAEAPESRTTAGEVKPAATGLPGSLPAVTPAPESPLAAVVNPVFLPDAAVVKGAYIQHCSPCHGADGRGDGPAAPQLYPRPRDFVASPFRFASAGGGQDALIAGLERTISAGVPRSPMVGFGGVLDESMIAGLARYVLSLRSSAQPAAPPPAIDVGTRPPTTPGLMARGAELFTTHGCITCHGASGHGDGEQSRTLVDSIGRPVRPADLASGIFKSGQGPGDLCRTILAGVPGTPMIAYEPVLTRTNPDGTRDLSDAWALVAFIQSLSPREPSIGHTSGVVLSAVPAADEAMLFDPGHVAWLGVMPISIELRPLWQRVESITHVDVRVVRTAERAAICVDWRDGTMDLGVGHAVFPDALAVMFAMGSDVPALPMGVHVAGFRPQAPVNILHWKASRQHRAVEGTTILGDGAVVAPQQSWRVYGLPSEPLVQPEPVDGGLRLPSFFAAIDAGNHHESLELIGRAVLEANAEGFGTLKLQPPDQQNAAGTAAWSSGVWRVVLVRSIVSPDAEDVDLSDPRRIPMALAVWDGSKGDRDGIKLVSGWHWLSVVEPEEVQRTARAETAQDLRKGSR